MSRSILIIPALCLALAVESAGQIMPFTHYTADSEINPLPSAEVYGVHQDGLGYMWFAVYSSGLVRYDGHTMHLYTTAHGLRDLSVRRVAEDAHGYLWVASDGGISVSSKPLHAYDVGEAVRFTTSVGDERLVDTAIGQKALATDSTGAVWVGTVGRGIFRYAIDDGRLATSHFSTNLRNDDEGIVESIIVLANGSVWATLEGPGYADILVFDEGDGKYRTLSEEVDGLPETFSSIAEDARGDLWIGTNHGKLLRISAGEPRKIRVIEDSFPLEVQRIVPGPDRVWVAAAGLGLVGVSTGSNPSIESYRSENGLLSESLHDILLDREGNLWLSQSGGISKLRSNFGAFRSYTSASMVSGEPALGAPAVSSVVAAPSAFRKLCDVYAATAAGVSCLSSRGGILLDEDLLRSNALVVDGRGRLWVGTDTGIRGLSSVPGMPFPPAPVRTSFRVDGHTITSHSYRRTSIHAGTALPMPVRAGSEEVSESVWLPGFYSLYLLVDENWYVFRPDSGLPPTTYVSVAFDADGRLLVGTRDRGLFRTKRPLTVESLAELPSRDSPTVLGDRPGIFGTEIVAPIFEPVWSTSIGEAPTDQIESLIVRNDVLFAGTPHGLFALDGDSLFVGVHITTDSGLPANNVLSMAVSPKTGNLWVGTNGGLAEIDGLAPQVLRTVTKADGLIDDEVWYLGSVFVDGDGIVYYGTANGLSIYNPEADRPNLVPATPRITDVRYRESGWGENEFAVEYAALSFAREKEMTYRSRLVPFEADWSEPTKDHRIRYTNLPAFFADRTYTFELQASNGSGVWTQQPLSWSFPVTPAFYLRWWALLSYLLLAGGAVYAFIQHKTRVQAEQLAQEREINERLRRIDRLKDEFLANTSHELRTPLNGIIGIAESMMDGVAGQLSHKAMSNIGLIIASGKRLANLVNDILDFSKLKERELELRRKAVDVSVLGDIVLRVSEPLIEGKNLILKNTMPRDLPPAFADENRLQQILYNLIGNAIKFTHEGSVVLSGRAEDGVLEIAVADTGIGIPADKQEIIFQSFEQVDASTAREYGGTGLGLAVTRQLVELHGGRIRVESTENVGSTFLFTLPVADGEAEALEAAEYLAKMAGTDTDTADDPDVAGKADEVEADSRSVSVGDEVVNVLVVDDEPINQQVMSNQLSVAGYRVTQALNGKEALEALEGETKFDIILLDVMMPRMSGFEVCNRIRKRYLPSELPVIMVTAKNQVADLVEGLSAGANDYITKPVSKSELLARIKTQLNLQRINSAYGRFVPREFLRYLDKESIIDVRLGDMVQKEMTIFVSDIRKFTTLSEKMSPEENFEFINAYLAQVSPVVRDHGGFIDRYSGDAIMALFPEEADHAVRASIDTLRILSEINQLRSRQGELPIEIGIGLHSGSLMLGIVGERERAQGDIFSDAVNLANRIEGLSKLYGASLVVSEETLRRLPPDKDYHQRFLGKVQVKGKNKHVAVFEIFDGDPEQMIDLKLRTTEDFEEGLQHYFGREFTNASVCFKKVLDRNRADKTAALYLRRSAQFMIQGVAESWEGVEAVDEISEGLPMIPAASTADGPPPTRSFVKTPPGSDTARGAEPGRLRDEGVRRDEAGTKRGGDGPPPPVPDFARPESGDVDRQIDGGAPLTFSSGDGDGRPAEVRSVDPPVDVEKSKKKDKTKSKSKTKEQSRNVDRPVDVENEEKAQKKKKKKKKKKEKKRAAKKANKKKANKKESNKKKSKKEKKRAAKKADKKAEQNRQGGKKKK